MADDDVPLASMGQGMPLASIMDLYRQGLLSEGPMQSPQDRQALNATPMQREMLARRGVWTAGKDLGPTATPGQLEAMGAYAADPFGIPSAVTRTVAPETGAAWQELEREHPEAELPGSMLTPGAIQALPARGVGMAARAAAAYPKIAAGLGAAGLSALPAEAGDQPTGRPQFTTEDQQRLGQLDTDIKSLTKQKQKAIENTGKSRIAATAQSYDDQIRSKQTEIDRMRGDMEQRQADYDKAGQPLAMRDPDTVDRIRKGAMMLSGGTGIVSGLANEPSLKALGKTLIGGLAEGAAGAYAPTMVDMFKPEDTQAYQMAHKNVWDPHYFGNVIAPELAYNTVLSGAGYGVGSAGREGLSAARDAVGSLFRPSPPPPPPSAPLTQVAAAVNARNPAAAAASASAIAQARAQHAAGTLSPAQTMHLRQMPNGRWIDTRTGYWSGGPPATP